MRSLIRNFDGLLRRALGVFEFCDERECLFRLQLARAPHDLHLSDGTEVRTGERALMLHLWNEHVPPMGPDAPDLAWAVSVHRMLIHSLHEVADNPAGLIFKAVITSNSDCPAVGGVVIPTNALALLAQWLAVIGLVGCISIAVVVARKPH